MLAFLAWWVIIQVFGLAAAPLVRRIFAWLPDGGYAFNKTAGLLLVSYLLWLGASSGLLTNTTGGILFALLLVALVSGWLLFSGGWDRARSRVSAFWRAERWQILAVEALFLAAFAGWALVRAYTPDKIMPAGGEKYMEIAFLNGVLNSPRFPPLDPWMAGYAISYYYFGYVMMAVMTALSAVQPGIGFDLYDALLFALTAISAYGLAANLVRSARGSRRAAALTGLLGAVLVNGMGNLQGLLEGLYASAALPAGFWQWLNIPDLAGSAQSGQFYPGHGWWWWRASRVLQDLNLRYEPAVFSPIDEFPFFSFLLGDNHPHKLALPFVLLTAGLAFNLLLRAVSPREERLRPPPGLTGWCAAAAWLWLRRGEVGRFLFYALGLGSLGFLNTWDFPIYLALVLLADLGGQYLARRGDWTGLPGRALALGAGLGATSLALYVFFYLGFSSQAGGVLPYLLPPTRLAQYLVMFGPLILILAVFLVLFAGQAGAWRAALRAWIGLAGLLVGVYLLVLLAGALLLTYTSLGTHAVVQAWLGGYPPFEAVGLALRARLADPWLFLLLSAVLALATGAALRLRLAPGKDSPRSAAEQATALFALLLTLLGVGLTLSTEFFFLRDNFGARMNTIFKFYFQGWVLMACASAFAVWWVSRHAARLPRVLFLTGAALLVAAGLIYPVMSVASRTEGFSRAPHLDAAATFAGAYPGHWAAQPDDWAAAQWLRENGQLPDGQAPVILEAGSGGYEIAGRISAFTGFPTLLGWTNHEGQWRGSSAEINRRKPVIEAIFTTPSGEQALGLLREWKVRYVIFGQVEQHYILKLCQNPEQPCNTERALRKFDQVLTPVFSSGNTVIYQVPP